MRSARKPGEGSVLFLRRKPLTRPPSLRSSVHPLAQGEREESQRSAARLSLRAGCASADLPSRKDDGLERRSTHPLDHVCAFSRRRRALRRSTAALFGPGPRFRDEAFASRSASSWEGDRSVPRVEPRVARGPACLPAAGRRACRPGLPDPAAVRPRPHLRSRPPVCSGLKTPHECAPLPSRVREG